MTASYVYGADNALIVLNMRGQVGKLNLINMNMQRAVTRQEYGTLERLWAWKIVKFSP